MKIAIIGSGISGLGAAYLLHKRHDIAVYEKNALPGGHSRTIEVAGVPVDTGFIVYNERNYPHLTGLFRHLGVATQNSDMSFGASIGRGFLEYGSKGMFAQRKNIFRPAFWGMIADILRFNRQAKAFIESHDLTLGECLGRLGLGAWFRDYYLLAMGAAIWSCPVETMLRFPASSFIRFFDNHGLLTVNGHPQWRTVTGGSRAYVKRLTSGFEDKIKTNRGAVRVVRGEKEVTVHDACGGAESYDHVIFASHADQTLAMLADPTPAERDILGAFSYQDNIAVTHGDTSFMPGSKGAWASWVYLSESEKDDKPAVSLTYWMNNLQGLPSARPLLVTLNPARRPRADLIHDEHTFSHPVFTLEAVRAQARIPEIQGRNRTHFCGAWQRYGFHEDGLMSAVAVARDLGAPIPWA